MNVANRIAELRKARGISLTALADRTEQHFTTVARHQSGSIATIPRVKLDLYAKIFECKILDLFLDPTDLPGGSEIESGAG